MPSRLHEYSCPVTSTTVSPRLRLVAVLLSGGAVLVAGGPHVHVESRSDTASAIPPISRQGSDDSPGTEIGRSDRDELSRAGQVPSDTAVASSHALDSVGGMAMTSRSAAGIPDRTAGSAPPASGVAPSPISEPATSSLPAHDLPGWRLVIAEDFDRDAPIGSFAQTYPGWAKYDSWRDTSRDLGRPRVAQGRYDSATTTTVQGGILDVFVRTVGRTPQVMALTPPIAGEQGGGQAYGRYAVRFRTDEVPGYKVAWLLWPASDTWQEGEINFPEGNLGGPIHGYSHDVSGNPSHNAWIVETNAPMTEWHTAVIEWTPERLTYSLDGRAWSTTDALAIPRDPMNWILQVETQLSSSPPDPDASGHVYIDWVAAWRLS